MLWSPAVIASNDDSESEISLYKVKKGVFFNEVSCFVCQGHWSRLFPAAVGSLLTVPLLLSGESTVAPQPQSEYRFYLSGFYPSSPLPRPLIFNLVPFPFYSLYQILLPSCT